MTSQPSPRSIVRFPALAFRFAFPATAALIAVLISLLAGCHEQASPPAAPPSARVTVATPIERETLDMEEFSGRTDAVESVEIRSRVTGYLEEIAFWDGQEVKKDQLLYKIDARPFNAALDQAKAQVTLREADLKYRTSELERAKPLLPKNAISQSDFDQIVAAHGQAVAALAAAHANEAAAQLNVDFTVLKSPIDGKVSRSQITRGNLVQADQTVLTTVVSVDPMFVYFDADEPTILKIQEAVRKGQIKPSKTELLPIWLELADNEGFRHQGVVDFAENRFDWKTGTIRVRGRFRNPKPETGDRILFPGLYGRVRLPLSMPYKAIMIAERAIGVDQGQKYVYVLNNKNEVEYRAVTLGRLDDRLRVITAGLSLGDRVIVTGQQRVRPGETVETRTVDMESFATASHGAKQAKDAKQPKETGEAKDAEIPNEAPKPSQDQDAQPGKAEPAKPAVTETPAK